MSKNAKKFHSGAVSRSIFQILFLSQEFLTLFKYLQSFYMIIPNNMFTTGSLEYWFILICNKGQILCIRAYSYKHWDTKTNRQTFVQSIGCFKKYTVVLSRRTTFKHDIYFSPSLLPCPSIFLSGIYQDSWYCECIDWDCVHWKIYMKSWMKWGE